MRQSILLLVMILLGNNFIFGQTRTFKKYSNASHHFSLDIPASWAIKFSKEQEGFICVPLNKSEKDQYSDCFEGIVFRMEFFKMGLDSLLHSGNYTKKGDAYYTTGSMRDSVLVKKINGKNWTGIYHNNICGISCKDNGFHAAGGQCEFLYFSNGKITVRIETNGREFDERILKRIISSFTFN